MNIKTLFDIASKSERRIVGLMSGTSIDGLDIALCAISGSGIETRVTVEQFETASYSEQFVKDIREVFSKTDVKLQDVTLLNAEIGIEHARLVNEALLKWNISFKDVDAIASHGQTVFHAPKSFHKQNSRPNATLQIGDGDHIAQRTGILTVSDFRQKHIAHGGEGAPLAVYVDYLLFGQKEVDKILLNIGGISNFTYLRGKLEGSRMFSTDVGPGNTLMDQYMQRYFSQPCDFDAIQASKGKVHIKLLEELLLHPFLKLEFPRTTGPELFSLGYVESVLKKLELKNLTHEDVMATLCAFTAHSIIGAVQMTVPTGASILVSGGGLHNPLLLNMLKEGLLDYTFDSMEDYGVHPDAKEAILFAVLANETLVGEPIDLGIEGLPKTTFGKISFPN